MISRRTLFYASISICANFIWFLFSRAKKESIPQPTVAATRVHWAFLHYHKTGHDLCRHIVSGLASSCTLGKSNIPKRNSLFNHTVEAFESIVLDKSLKTMYSQSDVAFFVPGALAFDWTKAFQYPHHQIRFIHFIRDPFETIMSGYLYHSQYPPPGSEHWMQRADFSFCDHDPNHLVQATKILGKLHGNQTLLEKWMDSALKDCKYLLSVYRRQKTDSYYEILQATAVIPPPNLRSKQIGDKGGSSLFKKTSVSKKSDENVNQRDEAKENNSHNAKIEKSRSSKDGSSKKKVPTSAHKSKPDHRNLASKSSKKSGKSAVDDHPLGTKFHQRVANQTMVEEVYAGIKIETYRAIFGGGDVIGDLLSMAINVLYQQPQIAMSFHLEEFALGNETKFRESSKRMFDFLYQPILEQRRYNFGDKSKTVPISTTTSDQNKIEKGKAEVTESIENKNTAKKSSKNLPNKNPSDKKSAEIHHDKNHRALLFSNALSSEKDIACPLCQCLNVTQAVDVSVKAAFVSTEPSKSSGKTSKHITQAILTRDQRSHYIYRLRDDPHVGPLLRFLANIVHHHRDNKHIPISP